MEGPSFNDRREEADESTKGCVKGVVSNSIERVEGEQELWRSSQGSRSLLHQEEEEEEKRRSIETLQEKKEENHSHRDTRFNNNP